MFKDLEELKSALIDYEQTKDVEFCNYIALVFNDYNEKQFNRFDYTDYHIITGDDREHAISSYNACISHDNVISLCWHSTIILEEDL